MPRDQMIVRTQAAAASKSAKEGPKHDIALATRSKIFVPERDLA